MSDFFSLFLPFFSPAIYRRKKSIFGNVNGKKLKILCCEPSGKAKQEKAKKTVGVGKNNRCRSCLFATQTRLSFAHCDVCWRVPDGKPFFYLSRIVISTRRFFAIPSGVAFDAMGTRAPNPCV